MTDHIEAVWDLMTANYGYIQKEKAPKDLALLLDIWKQLLADVPPEALKAAALQHIATSKWFPTVAELRELARELTRPPRLSGIEAWGIVKSAMHKWGIYGKPEFDDPNIAKAVKVIGWNTICMSEMEAPDRARFVECYETLTKREDRAASLLPQVRAILGETSRKLLE